mgnify:CR=1 FL=1
MNRRFLVTGFVVLAIGYVFAISHSQTDTHANVPEIVKSAVVTDADNSAELAESDNRSVDVAASNLQAIEQTRALVHVQRPQWRQNDSLNQLFEELKAQARAGNTAAAYVLGMNLHHCYYVPVDDVELAEKLFQASEFKDNGQALTDIQQRYDYCEGISRVERDGFYRYLELAAARGDVPAQEAIAELTPELYMAANNFAELGRDEYVEKRQSFVRQQLDFLASAAQHGSLKALVKLSQLHYAQTAGEDGRLQAYAFNEMILALTDDSELQNRYHWFQQRALNEFTVEEIERAVTMAEQWLARINANGSVYSHNN